VLAVSPSVSDKQPAMRAAWVAVPVPSLDLLTYRVPADLPLPPRGGRVLVPVGTRVMTGCVVRVDDVAEGPTAATGDAVLRDVVEVLDEEAFLPAAVLDLALWVADYYACAPGEAVAAAMPPFAWVASMRRLRITEAGRAWLERRRPGFHEDMLGPAGVRRPPGGLQEAVLGALADGRPRSPGQIAAAIDSPIPSVRSVAAAVERAGLAASEQVLRGRAHAFKTVAYAALTVSGEDALRGQADGGGRETEGRVPALGGRQREALSALGGTPGGAAVSALRRRGISQDTVRRLAARGFVALRRERVERDLFRAPALDAGGAAGPGGPEPAAGRVALTAEQAGAVEQLEQLADAGRFESVLIHGVTGSGKTEVYVRLAGAMLGRGRRTLVLVPEIALTPALAATFRAAFGGRVAILHSGLGNGERHDQWRRIHAGEVDVVVGTRSAVFAPLPDLGAIVVDEEHDPSYKQEESPRYNGRDVAVMRAKREHALVVLGSATPAVETYHNATTGRYRLLALPRRVLDRPLAAVQVVNMRDEYARLGPEVVFSQPLEQAIADRLSRAEQVLVLLNRRGFATAVFCRQCGGTIDCPNCSVSLTVHTGGTWRARCHYCNYSSVVPKACPACGAPYLEQVGLGTQRIEAEAARLFPGARVARLDRDVLTRRGAVVDVLGRFARREIDLLIGTQMIAKGHDFPRVTLVGVISADVGLGLPDFRAAERTFQLLTQVVGRAGRGEQAGEAIIQTLHPEHYSVRHACRQDYAAFFEEEMRYRRALRYPPVVSLVNVVVRGPSLRGALDDATDLVERLRAASRGRGDVRVLGPAPAPLGRLKGEHRCQLFVKGPSRGDMREALRLALAARADLARRISVDVDPLTVL
jgi:primosomal protein N' (replication factor Y)